MQENYRLSSAPSHAQDRSIVLTTSSRGRRLLIRFSKALQEPMTKRRATIRSVAGEAGVSITTVSNVINGRHEQMAPETLDRVLSAMERLGYRPNRVAQSLVTSRTATIGLIMGEVTNA